MSLNEAIVESTGGRDAVYHLPGEAISTPDDVFGLVARILVTSSPNLASNRGKVSTGSPYLVSSSPNLDERRDANDCLMIDLLAWPIIDDLRLKPTILHTDLKE